MARIPSGESVINERVSYRMHEARNNRWNEKWNKRVVGQSIGGDESRTFISINFHLKTLPVETKKNSKPFRKIVITIFFFFF